VFAFWHVQAEVALIAADAMLNSCKALLVVQDAQMEVYYKDLISEDASLDKLVDEVTLLVQGANELAESAGVALPPHHRDEIVTRLERLKQGCRRVKEQAVLSAVQTRKVMRRYPYSSAGLAFALGVLVGAAVLKRRRSVG